MHTFTSPDGDSQKEQYIIRKHYMNWHTFYDTVITFYELGEIKRSVPQLTYVIGAPIKSIVERQIYTT